MEQINSIDSVYTLKHVPAADNHELGSGKAVVPVDLRKSGRQTDLGTIPHVIINDDAQLTVILTRISAAPRVGV